MISTCFYELSMKLKSMVSTSIFQEESIHKHVPLQTNYKRDQSIKNIIYLSLLLQISI